MSKHTNKVHGKLNFLMIAVVVVIGAVSYLLVQSGTIDPSQGTSSGIKGVQKADKYVSKNDVVVELDGEEIQDVLNNPDFQRMITSGEFQKLASDEDFVKVLDNKDGIGILGDIFKSLDFVNNVDINKGDLSGDPTQSRAGNAGAKRGLDGSSGSIQNANSENPNIVGQRGNPANNDSGINGIGGAVLLGAINPASLNKISDFQKFMKGADLQKFMKGADFAKFAKSSSFQKFAKNEDFAKFMMRGDFQKFMKSSAYAKFAKGQTFEKFMKGADFQKFMKGARFQKNM